MREFDHIGIFTSEPHDGEFWVESLSAWVTKARLHPLRMEYIRFKNMPEIDPAEVGQWKLWNLPHVAYRVDDLDAAIKGEEVLFGPAEPAEFGRIAFVHKDGAIIEYIEYTTLDTWFGQPTPWKSTDPTVD